MSVNYPLLTINAAPTNGVNELQSLAITGAPAGGTFTMAYDGQTTAPLAYNASAADVQAALQALSNIAAGDVVCAGGALPGTAITIGFRRNLGGLNVSAIVADGTALTGGTAPAAAVTTTTAGVRGTYRGAQNGALLQDATNGRLYRNDGDAYTPGWTEVDL